MKEPKAVVGRLTALRMQTCDQLERLTAKARGEGRRLTAHEDGDARALRRDAREYARLARLAGEDGQPLPANRAGQTWEMGERLFLIVGGPRSGAHALGYQLPPGGRARARQTVPPRGEARRAVGGLQRPVEGRVTRRELAPRAGSGTMAAMVTYRERQAKHGRARKEDLTEDPRECAYTEVMDDEDWLRRDERGDWGGDDGHNDMLNFRPTDACLIEWRCGPGRARWAARAELYADEAGEDPSPKYAKEIRRRAAELDARFARFGRKK